MSDTVLISVITGIPAILTSLANLILGVKGNTKITTLGNLVNGKFSEMLDIVRESSEVRGKIETLEKSLTPTTTVISDRRKEEK